MTIQKRAREWSKYYVGKNRQNIVYIGYEKGATDQRKIDVEKGKAFCKAFFDELVANDLPELKDEPFYTQGLEMVYSRYLKAMED